MYNSLSVHPGSIPSSPTSWDPAYHSVSPGSKQHWRAGGGWEGKGRHKGPAVRGSNEQPVLAKAWSSQRERVVPLRGAGGGHPGGGSVRLLLVYSLSFWCPANTCSALQWIPAANSPVRWAGAELP